jgi:hypothetical protein
VFPRVLGPTCRLPIGRSRWFSRAIGRPGWKRGVPGFPLPVRRAARARRLSGKERPRADTRWVGRSRIGRFGFWVSRAPVCGRPASAFVFSAAGTSCLGLSPLSGFTGAVPRVHRAACTSGRKRMPRRVPPIARRRLSRPVSAHGVRVRRVGRQTSSVSNTNPVAADVLGAGASTFRMTRDATRFTPDAADVPSAC